ncbi:MAG TPA: glutathione S-transferase N-terminal domain-containing protein [Polyangiaceae bacterium]|jgi:glutathione S-transferase
MIKLYGSPVSTCTRKVLMTLAETDTNYEMMVIDFATGAHKKEPHISRQPFGRIPAIDDDGFEMFESRAIARYLAEKAKSPLIPKDIHARAKMEQWISIETSELAPHAMKFVYEHTFKRKQDQAVLDGATTALKTTLGVMSGQLAKTSFISGDAFTIADIGYMPYLEYVMAGPAKELVTPFERVVAWWEMIRARPTWQKVIGKA